MGNKFTQIQLETITDRRFPGDVALLEIEIVVGRCRTSRKLTSRAGSRTPSPLCTFRQAEAEGQVEPESDSEKC